MSQFPTLATGAVLQYPAEKQLRYTTGVTRFLDGSEQRFRDFSDSIKYWVVNLQLLTEQELRQVQDFFDNQQGKFGIFTFIDPWDQTTYSNCSFATDSLDADYVDESRGRYTLVIRNNKG
jgi:uncharacterized protein DUF2460